jgi:IS6 family transposase
VGVLNQGIAGSRMLHDSIGPNALARFDRDVLSQTGVTHVIVQMGQNDIFTVNPADEVTADQVIQAHRQLIERAHAKGLRIFGCTITPNEGFLLPGTPIPVFTAAKEIKRQAVNAWIRTGGEYDAVIDFDRILRDPGSPTRILPSLDSGDHGHPAVSQTGWRGFGTVSELNQSRSALFRGRHFRDDIIVLCVRWYLRYPLSYRDLEEMMAERGLTVDHSTIARWVLHYAPILQERVRREMRQPNRSWRVDETYIRVAGQWTYLYRAVDSAGDTIDFLLSPKRDRVAAKGFLQLALSGHSRPRVINVDGHPAYPAVIEELKQSGELGRKCQCRPSPYVNNIIEQDHRFVKKRVVASQWFRSVDGALNTIAGYEAMNIIRKGQIRRLAKGDIIGQARFIERTLGIAA